MADDIQHDLSRSWLDAWLVKGNFIIAPTLLLAEIGGAVARRTGDAVLGQAAIDTVLLTPGLQWVALDNALSTVTARRAAALGLRGADATYVAVAQHFDVPLLTWDDEQATRARVVVPMQAPDEA